jgi:diaminopimelate decarboxylase
MKKLLFVFSVPVFLTLISCEKENDFDTVVAKWTLGDSGKMDTILTFKAKDSEDMIFKIGNYSICPTHNVSLTVKVNDAVVLQKTFAAADSTGQVYPVKANDNVSVQTKLVETGAKINCVTLGRAECELAQ